MEPFISLIGLLGLLAFSLYIKQNCNKAVYIETVPSTSNTYGTTEVPPLYNTPKIDGPPAYETNTNETNTNEMNTNEMNTNETNTNEANTNELISY